MHDLRHRARYSLASYTLFQRNGFGIGTAAWSSPETNVPIPYQIHCIALACFACSCLCAGIAIGCLALLTDPTILSEETLVVTLIYAIAETMIFGVATLLSFSAAICSMGCYLLAAFLCGTRWLSEEELRRRISQEPTRLRRLPDSLGALTLSEVEGALTRSEPTKP